MLRAFDDMHCILKVSHITMFSLLLDAVSEQGKFSLLRNKHFFIKTLLTVIVFVLFSAVSKFNLKRF